MNRIHSGFRVPFLVVGLAASLGLAALAAGRTPRKQPQPVAITTSPAPATVSQSTFAIVTPDRAKSALNKRTAKEPIAPGTAGMRVAFDPETGALGPAPAVAGAPALNWSSEGLHEVRLPDGSYMIDLQGRFQEYAILEVGPDGQRRMRCVQDPTAIHRHSPFVPRAEE